MSDGRAEPSTASVLANMLDMAQRSNGGATIGDNSGMKGSSVSKDSAVTQQISGNSEIKSSLGQSPPPPPPPLQKVSAELNQTQTVIKPAGGKWSQEEDDRLREIVKDHGPKNWKAISSLAFNGARSDVQCLHRWQKVLRPGLVKGPWLQSEDEIIVHLIKIHGLGNIKWSEIAANLPGRLGKQCRERWVNHLDPGLKKTPWTEEEDRILMERQQILGNKWREIAVYLPGRSENSVKNRWNSARRKRKRTEAALADHGRQAAGERQQALDGSKLSGSLTSPSAKREKKSVTKPKASSGRRPGRPKGSTNKVKRMSAAEKLTLQQNQAHQDSHMAFTSQFGANSGLFGFNFPGQQQGQSCQVTSHQNPSNARLSPSFLPMGFGQLPLGKMNVSPTLNDLDIFFSGSMPASTSNSSSLRGSMGHNSSDTMSYMPHSFPGFLNGKDGTFGTDASRVLGSLSPVYFNVSGAPDQVSSSTSGAPNSLFYHGHSGANNNMTNNSGSSNNNAGNSAIASNGSGGGGSTNTSNGNGSARINVNGIQGSRNGNSNHADSSASELHHNSFQGNTGLFSNAQTSGNTQNSTTYESLMSNSLQGRQARTRSGNVSNPKEAADAGFPKNPEDILDMYANGSEALFRSLVSPPPIVPMGTASLFNTANGTGSFPRSFESPQKTLPKKETEGRNLDFESLSKPSSSETSRTEIESQPQSQTQDQVQAHCTSITMPENDATVSSNVKEEDDKEGVDLGPGFTLVGKRLSKKHKDMLRYDGTSSMDEKAFFKSRLNKSHDPHDTEVLGISTRAGGDSEEMLELFTFDDLVGNLVDDISDK